MPNLKNALLAQQHGAARHATIRKAEEHRKSKASSVKASVTGTKVAAKRARKSALLPPADTTSGFKSKGKGKAKVQSPTIPFARDDTILLLGEANFSYAISLIQEPHNHPPHLLCATSYDSEEVCFKKYGDGAGNVKVLRERGVKVGFEVDAGDLDGKGGRGVIGKGRRWSRVIFNFPHVGMFSVLSFSTQLQI
jgi:25S rRNA (uracil2634-N3)-methyltransferase